ncbi:hypothetical protein D030_2769A, partial [Vibrio parahaemolyticus AQ3810]
MHADFLKQGCETYQ